MEIYTSRTPKTNLGCNNAEGKQEKLYLVCDYENPLEEVVEADKSGELWRLKLTAIRPMAGHAPDRCKIHNEIICNLKKFMYLLRDIAVNIL